MRPAVAITAICVLVLLPGCKNEEIDTLFVWATVGSDGRAAATALEAPPSYPYDLPLGTCRRTQGGFRPEAVDVGPIDVWATGCEFTMEFDSETESYRYDDSCASSGDHVYVTFDQGRIFADVMVTERMRFNPAQTEWRKAQGFQDDLVVRWEAAQPSGEFAVIGIILGNFHTTCHVEDTGEFVVPGEKLGVHRATTYDDEALFYVDRQNRASWTGSTLGFVEGGKVINALEHLPPSLR